MRLSSILFASCVLFSVLSYVSAHICMISPIQRGVRAGIDNPGDPSCYHKTQHGCEVTAPGPITTIVQGSLMNINFQQNLNHFYTNSSGKLAIQFAPNPQPQEGDFKYLAEINDFNTMDEVAMTNVTIPIEVPVLGASSARGVIRLLYLSNNPLENDTSTVFHQCSDVLLVPPTSLTSEKRKAILAQQQLTANNARVVSVHKNKNQGHQSHAKNQKPTQASTDCCTVNQFTITFEEIGSVRAPASGFYYYDNINKFMRYDVSSGTGKTYYDGSFRYYSNFTSGLEWVYNVVTGECTPYGLDFWNEWCYGSLSSENFASYETIGTTSVSVFTQNGAGWVRKATTDQCIPVMHSHSSAVNHGITTIFKNFIPYVTPDVFELPSTCVLKPHLHASQLPKSSTLEHHKSRHAHMSHLKQHRKQHQVVHSHYMNKAQHV